MDPNGEAYGSADVINNSEYLGEIAAAPPPKQRVWPKWLAIIGGGIAIFTALVFIVMNAASDPRPTVVNDAQQAYGRAQTLSTLTREQRGYFNSGELRAVSADLQSVLENLQRNITVILDANGVRSPSAPASEAEVKAELEQQFQDARILMTLERTYVSEMTFQIEMLRALLFQLETKLTVIDHRTFISDIYEQLEVVSERLNRILLT